MTRPPAPDDEQRPSWTDTASGCPRYDADPDEPDRPIETVNHSGEYL